MIAEQFLKVAETLPEPMLLLSDDGVIRAINRASVRRFGKAVTEWQSRSIVELVSEPSEEVNGYLRNCGRSRDMVLGALTLRLGSETIACRTEGTLFQAKSANSPAFILLRLLPKNESILGQFFTLNERIDRLGREIRLRQRAEASLRDSEEGLHHANLELAKRLAQLEKANAETRDSRRAALNLIEDAVQSRQNDERQKRALELVAHNAPLAEVFGGLVSMLQEGKPTDVIACIMLLDEDGLHLRMGAAPHLPETYTRAIDGIAIGPKASSCGTAAFLRKPVYVADIASNPLWKDHAELALSHNLRACWSTPIFSATGRMLGTIAMYFPDVREPNDLDLQGVETAVRIASIAIERKRAEYEQRRLVSVIENSTDFIGVADANGKLIFANPAAMKLAGVDNLDRIRQSKITDFFIPQQRNFFEETVLPTVMREGHWAGELTFQHFKTGAAIPVQHDLFRIDDPATGQPINIATVTRDISHRKRAEEKLRESDERFRNLADHIPQLAWIADVGTEGKVHWFNRGWFEYTGTTLEEMQGSGWKSVHHPDYVERVAAKFEHHVKEGLDWEDTFPLRGKDGQYRWFLSRMKVIRDEAGEVMQIFGTNTDITAQRDANDALAKAKEQIEAASRAKDDFLAALSHELRTPLTPVLMTANALERDPSLSAEVRNQLSMMRRNIELEARLIDDLLDLTRITRGKLHLHRLPTDLHELLTHTAEIARGEDVGKEVSMEFRFEASRSHVLADPARLQQVFWNLIKNALKFTPPGGTITVRTRNDRAQSIEISVEDTGVGISAEALPHIFKAFEQGNASVAHRYGGLGLGLAIAQAIVGLHEGKIHAQSEGPGRGSIFTVSLATIDALAGPDRPNVHSALPTRELQLLIVEDHEATRTVLTRLLARKGHRITTAGSVREALAAFATERFDAVISDLGLPDGSGIEMMQEMRSQRSIFGIALTGYGMENDIQRTREAGFFAHLVKPVNFDQLDRLISEISPNSND